MAIVHLLLSPFYFFLSLSDNGHPPSKGSLSVGNMISKLDHALLYYLCLVPTEYCDYYSLVKRVYLGTLVELSIDLAFVAGLLRIIHNRSTSLITSGGAPPPWLRITPSGAPYLDLSGSFFTYR